MIFYHYLLLVASFAGLVTVGIIRRSKERDLSGNRLLVLSIFSLTAFLASTFLFERDLFTLTHAHPLTDFLLVLSSAFSFLYVREIIESKPFARADGIHFIPAAFFLVNGVQRNFFPFRDTHLADDMSPFTMLRLPELFPIGLKFTVMGLYGAMQVWFIWKFYRDDIRSGKIQTLAWRHWVLIFILLEWTTLLAVLSGTLWNAEFMQFATQISIVVLIGYTLVTVLRKPEILYGLEQAAADQSSLSEQALLATLRDHEFNNGNFRTLDIPNGEAVLEKLTALMEEDRPYLLKSYTQQDLSRELQIPDVQVALLLNKILGLSFADYMDQQRIFHCQERIRTGSAGDLSLDQLSASCGFGSKALFMKAFKRFTATDPVTYRKEYRRSL